MEKEQVNQVVVIHKQAQACFTRKESSLNIYSSCMMSSNSACIWKKINQQFWTFDTWFDLFIALPLCLLAHPLSLVWGMFRVKFPNPFT